MGNRKCKLCGAPIRYADRRRRFPLDERGGHVCLSRRVGRVRWPKGAALAMSFITDAGPLTYFVKPNGSRFGEVVEVRPGLIEMPRVREQCKGSK